MNNLKKLNAAIAWAFVFLSIFAHADSKTRIEIADDQFYFGEILNGQPHGEGEMTWADGRKYEGEWKRGKRHGTGKYTYSRESTGDNYSGDWLDDKRSGFGTLTMKSGRVMKGRWVSGDFKGEAHAQTSTGWVSTTNPCSDSARMRAAKRDVTSYRSEIADLNAEKRRLDGRLRQFDKRYESSKLSKRDRQIALLNAGGQGGLAAVGRRGEQLDREAAQKRQIYEDARFELQNQITEMKLLLNREIRNAQRYLADAEDRIDRLRESEC